MRDSRSVPPSVLALAAALALLACGGGGGSEAPRPSLTVNVVGNGFVTSSPAGIDCHTDCAEAYALDTVVRLVPIAGVGHAFAGWSGDADCSDGNLTLSAARQCTATFVAATAPRIAAGKGFSLARSASGSAYS